MTRGRLSSILKTLLKLAVTALLLWYVSTRIDFAGLRTLVLHSNPIYITLAFLVYAGSLFIASWRNLGLLKDIGLDLGYWYYFKLYMLGVFYNLALPGGVGGDGYKIYVLRKQHKTTTKRLFLVMLFDRLSGLWAIGFITVALILFIPRIEIHPALAVLALAGGTGIYYVVMRRFFKEYTRSFFATHFKAGLFQSVQMLVVILLLFSQDFSAKFSPYLFSFQVATVAANVPLSFGGVGIREVVMTNASGYFGMDAHLAVYLSFGFYLISALVALCGVFFMYGSNKFESAPSAGEAEEFEKTADETITSSRREA